MFNRIRFKALLLELVLVPTWVILMYYNRDAADFSGIDIFLTFLRTFNVWLTLVVLLGYGHKYLNFKHKILPYMNEAAFPIYIVHQSVLVVVAYFILKLPIGIFPMYLMILVATFVISLAFYEYVIKQTALTRWLFGVKVTTKNQEKKFSERSFHT